MNKNIKWLNSLWVILITVIIIVILDIYFLPKEKSLVFDGRNSTFTLDGEIIKLVNGKSADSKVHYFGNEAEGDLDGDGQKDMAFLITSEPGGSGTFYYAVVALKTVDGYKTTNAFFVGDRISPQSTYIPENSRELQVAYAERRAGEPMTTPPSVGAVLLLKVSSTGILEGLMK